VYVHVGPRDAQLGMGTASRVIGEMNLTSSDNAILLFLAYSFDPLAREDLQSMGRGLAKFEVLLADINADLQTEDLKRKEKSGESFWLIGQPDVELRKREDGDYEVEVRGYDYFNFQKGKHEFGGAKDIAMWMLDSDYDGRSLFPTQVFFPDAGGKDGWHKLAKNLKAELDPEKLEAFHGTVSLPFPRPQNGLIALKIIDTRGIEMMRILNFN
jgi:adenine-specific DNA-methyltransferase